MILGFNFTSVDAHVNEQNLSGALDVQSVPSIEDVVEKKLDFIGENKSIGIKFVFKTNYGKAGEIVQKGEVIYKVDDAKKHLKRWKDEKKLNDEMTLNVLNFLLSKCITKAVDYADMLRLPPPLQFPQVVKEDKTKTVEVFETKKK
jgi:hypothetical protein